MFCDCGIEEFCEATEEVFGCGMDVTVCGCMLDIFCTGIIPDMFCAGIPEVMFCGGIPGILCGGIPDTGGIPALGVASAVLDDVTAEEELAVVVVMPLTELCDIADEGILEFGDIALGGSVAMLLAGPALEF